MFGCPLRRSRPNPDPLLGRGSTAEELLAASGIALPSSLVEGCPSDQQANNRDSFVAAVGLKFQNVALSEEVVWQLLQEYAAAAGVPGIAPHDLRRYAESRTIPN